VTEPSQSFEEKGFAIVPKCLAAEMVKHLSVQLGDEKHAQRNLLCDEMVRRLAASEPVKALLDSLFSNKSFAVSHSSSVSTTEHNLVALSQCSLKVVSPRSMPMDAMCMDDPPLVNCRAVMLLGSGPSH
jgi:hypothetical protein